MKLIFSIILLLVLSFSSAMAQPGDPGGDPDVPIGGIELLIGLGGALGVRKLILAARNKSEK